MSDNPTRSVVIALLMAMVVFAVARGKLSERITSNG